MFKLLLLSVLVLSSMGCAATTSNYLATGTQDQNAYLQQQLIDQQNQIQQQQAVIQQQATVSNSQPSLTYREKLENGRAAQQQEQMFQTCVNNAKSQQDRDKCQSAYSAIPY